MIKRPLAGEIAAELGVKERVLLFCLASGTDWERAGVTHSTAQHILVPGARTVPCKHLSEIAVMSLKMFG
jgi:hypothetical protein